MIGGCDVRIPVENFDLDIFKAKVNLLWPEVIYEWLETGKELCIYRDHDAFVSWGEDVGIENGMYYSSLKMV